MSRSGYCEDFDEAYPNSGELYRANVDRSFAGKRGQAFLRELLAALDALPEKRLIATELESSGEVCALGAVGRARGIDVRKLDPEDARSVGKAFRISEMMAREIVFENDDDFGFIGSETPEQRFARMRAWAASHILTETQP